MHICEWEGRREERIKMGEKEREKERNAAHHLLAVNLNSQTDHDPFFL